MDDIYILIARSDSVKFYRNTSLITRIALWDFFISLKVGTSFFIIIDSVTAKYCSIAFIRGTQRQFSEEYLFGRRFEI